MLVEYPGEERRHTAASYIRHLCDMGLVKAVKLLAAVAPKCNIFFSETKPRRPVELDPRVVATPWARVGIRCCAAYSEFVEASPFKTHSFKRVVLERDEGRM